ncbi:hypothetical protein LX36DRAFT_43130 [Colletotrichum falcatum]|nr:hypothetical protein LX36DRAFT_43130 [Colletotrichum falcatum]
MGFLGLGLIGFLSGNKPTGKLLKGRALDRCHGLRGLFRFVEADGAKRANSQSPATATAAAATAATAAAAAAAAAAAKKLAGSSKSVFINGSFLQSRRLGGRGVRGEPRYKFLPSPAVFHSKLSWRLGIL